MYASINYIHTRHPYADISGQPSQAPAPAPPPPPPEQQLTNGTATISQQPNGPARAQAQQPQDPPASPPPELPDAFEATLHELARSLVLQEQQIEVLIQSLPGLGNSEASQERRMRELEAELREVEGERAKAEAERERMMDMLGGVLVGARRVA